MKGGIVTSISLTIWPQVIRSEMGIEQCIILDLTDTSASSHIANEIMCEVNKKRNEVDRLKCLGCLHE